jgi:TRAP-type C4-dicarboxylate transport system permease small subunit
VILGRGVEWVCLALMVALCLDLMLGVFSRYVLFSTFTWYAEIARICFVWLVFLGAAVGVKRQAHFRLHLVVDALWPRARWVVGLFGRLVVIGFAAALVQQGWAFVELGRFQQTPVMGLPKSWVYLAMPVGGALIILYSLGPLWRDLRPPGGR